MSLARMTMRGGPAPAKRPTYYPGGSVAKSTPRKPAASPKPAPPPTPAAAPAAAAPAPTGTYTRLPAAPAPVATNPLAAAATRSKVRAAAGPALPPPKPRGYRIKVSGGKIGGAPLPQRGPIPKRRAKGGFGLRIAGSF